MNLDEVRRHLEFHPGIDPEPFQTHIQKFTESGAILRDTWCYPRGGGQPGDTGYFEVNATKYHFDEVTASVTGGETSIIHPLENDGLGIGMEVKVHIDVERRNSLASMHSAAHIVSAAANERWGAITVGNQLGIDSSRIDLKFEDRDLFNVETLEEDVNFWVDNNSRIKIHEWGRDKILTDERVRNKRFVSRIIDRLGGENPMLRMVEIEGIDLCPCAGTHLASTGPIGGVSIDRVQNKGKGTFRLHFRNEKSEEIDNL